MCRAKIKPSEKASTKIQKTVFLNLFEHIQKLEVAISTCQSKKIANA